VACTRFPSRTERASKLLAKGIKDVLDDFGAWTLHFQQLPDGDPVAKLLAQQLPNAEMTPDLWVPQVDFGDDPKLPEFLSRNMRRQIKKAWNRLETDGHHVEMRIARSEFEIMQVLPQVEAIHVMRDHDTCRESDLDDPRARELWRRLVLAHAASGQVEISTLHIDDRIAGFVIGIIDDDVYRVFDGHFDSEFHRYSPGRIIESAVLERAMADARFTGLDWMAGVAAEKILVSNHSEGRIQLVASAKSTAAPQPNPVPVDLGSNATVPAEAAGERTHARAAKPRKRASSTAVLDKA
jgi:CelD/BcsL family acetyltransferase involved in cellulose biosynthesis